MSDTGTPAPPRTSEFQGAQAAPTVDELRQQQAAMNGNGQPVAMQPQGRVWTQAEVDAERERVRTEMSQQLRPTIEATNAIQAQLAELQRERDEAAAEKARIEAEAAEAERQAEVAKMTLTQKFDHLQQETTERFRRIEEERALEQTVFQREREYVAQKEYRDQRLASPEVGGAIMPQLHDLVVIGTQEEVDQSIADMIARTNAVMADVQTAQQQAWMGQRGVSPTGTPASGPLENLPDTTREFTSQEIAAMSQAEYARNRPRLLQAASRHMNRR